MFVSPLLSVRTHRLAHARRLGRGRSQQQALPRRFLPLPASDCPVVITHANARGITQPLPFGNFHLPISILRLPSPEDLSLAPDPYPHTFIYVQSTSAATLLPLPCPSLFALRPQIGSAPTRKETQPHLSEHIGRLRVHHTLTHGPRSSAIALSPLFSTARAC